jgi:cytochrome P450
VVTHPKDVQIFFNDSDKHSKAKNNNAGWLMGELLGSCLGLINGLEWRNVRAVTVAPFTHKASREYVPLISKAIEDHFQTLENTQTLKNGFIHPVDDLRDLPFWVVADVLYGRLHIAQQQELRALMPIRDLLFKRMIQGGATRFSWSQFFSTSTNRDLRDFKQRWAKFHEDFYQESRNSEENPPPPALSMYEDMKHGKLSQEHLLQTLDEMLFANLDVTMGGLSWNLLFLARDEEVQDKIREELQTAPAWEEYIKSSSTLLAASILESARLKPLAAFSVAQSAPTPRVIGGFVIPAGTSIVVDTHSLNLRNPFWGTDREQYRPSRFLELETLDIRYQYWRYGFGPRQCLGKHVVDLIIRGILAHLLAHYSLSLHETSHWNRSPDTWISHPDSTICCERLNSPTEI